MALIAIRIVMVVAFLAMIHAAVSAYMRWDRRRALEAEYDDGAGRGLTRDDYVSQGMMRYERSWSKRALLAIFLVPLALVVGLMLIANYG